jgi:pyruvate dehydrogenase E2 component (dihydrolipoamide acetyltransferase)
MPAIEVKVPDIGDFHDIPVIDVLVKPGDRVAHEQSLVTLESEKATMDVPAPSAGTVTAVSVKVGDKVSQGSLVLLLEPAAAPAPGPGPEQPAPGRGAPAPVPGATPAPTPAPMPAPAAAPAVAQDPGPSPAPPPAPASPAGSRGPDEPRGTTHASPAVRRFARELGVALGQVTGSGPRGRILKEDVQHHVKEALAAPAGRGPGLELLPWPRVDFARFGPVETIPLPRIRRLSAANLARNWVMIPHVTQHDEADVTELEALRVRLNAERGAEGPKVTLLAFVMKACAAALQRHPELNASLVGDELVLKRYWHLGFAADTPQGLVVPVVRDVDRKGVLELARETAALAEKARAGKLGPADLQGGTFSISSLGGIGGTAFTPIINAPEVAILGLSRTSTRPTWDGQAFTPRLMLPLSLSYDHRVVDGALAARFVTSLSGLLADLRRALL